MKKYSKEEIINLLNRNISKGLLKVNGTVDELMGFLDYEDKELDMSDFMMDINHSAFKKFLIKGFNFKEVFQSSTMAELTQKIIDASGDWSKYYRDIDNDEEGSNKMKGDLFEIFAEIFFKLTSSDNRVGITNYNPVKSNEDYGVDGTGVDINNLPTTIQVKFRGNPKPLTIGDLHNFHGISYKHYNVPVDNGKIIIFTNCKGLHWNTETNVLKNSTITYGAYTENNRTNYNLQNLIDNNTSFWKNLNSMIKYNIDKIVN